jgi:Holliday junction resolvasome RuvABC endonuclease subunit
MCRGLSSEERMTTTSNRTLALDLATVCGWASMGGGVMTSGSHDFTRYSGSKRRAADHVGESYAMFHRWLAEKLRTDKPGAIAYEEVCRWGGYAAAHCFGGFRGHMLALAASHGIPCYGYTPSAVKIFWTGKGNADKGAMVSATRRKFPDVDLTDDNEADAIAILNLHLSKAQQVLQEVTP